jgi:bifunctional UDP-N-acetylglucosamine pyrophosphorylase/glucosamine-1-phosphate N-acetyltransferase
MKGTPGAFVVSNRQDLSRFQQRIRDQLVASLMEAGVTFLLPDSVMVDVDVRIGRDSVIYPGVILEGETNIGDETVIGPGCRIIDSWIGSGVEMKGWNYVAHTSVRNRAILEPHVRRGFD